MIGPDGARIRRTHSAIEAERLRAALLHTSPLTLSLPTQDQGRLSPAARLLAQDIAGDSYKRHIAITALKATCRGVLDSLHKKEFWQSPGRLLFDGERSRFDSDGGVLLPSVQAVTFGVFSQPDMEFLALSTSSLVLAAYFLKKALHNNDVTPLKCFDQIDRAGVTIDNEGLAQAAADLLKFSAAPVMLAPNKSCDSLEIVQESQRATIQAWSPLLNLQRERRQQQEKVADASSQPYRDGGYRRLRYLSDLGAVPPATADDYLASVLDQDGLIALAYGGYYFASVDQPRVSSINVAFAGEQQGVYTHMWEGLLNRMLSKTASGSI